MNDGFVDGLWPHFAPLWTDLRGISKDVLLAGGYGLFLKQRWLTSQLKLLTNSREQVITNDRGEPIVTQEIRTLVEISRWLDGTPRVTKDFDLLVSLDLIASGADQGKVDRALKTHGFTAVPLNERWQFQKKITESQSVMLDFHAPPPDGLRSDIRVQQRRIKPKPSLGEGIHGRPNAEAIGADLHAFSFMMDSVIVEVSNPVTLAMMKSVAMSECWQKSQGVESSLEKRLFNQRQAAKHANDLFKLVAMTTREENDRVPEILDQVRGAQCFDSTVKAFADHFQPVDGWGTQVVRGSWRDEDFELIRQTMGRWFAR